VDDFNLAGAEEMNRRRRRAEEFLEVAFGPEERPYFVSDEATLHDIYVGDELEVIARCRRHYGVMLRSEQFALPVWKILDILESGRSGE